MKSILPLLLCLLTIIPILAQQKCNNYYCDGATIRAIGTCQFGIKMTMDYGVTYKCVEEFLKEQYSGCDRDQESFCAINGRPDPGTEKSYVKLIPTGSAYFTCCDMRCSSGFLLVGNRFYCPQKYDDSCALRSKITTDYGLTYICLEKHLSSIYDCPGQWATCSNSYCEANSINYQGKLYHCTGLGCGNSGYLNKTGSTFVCAHSSCDYSQADAWPYPSYPLKWTLTKYDFNTNPIWECRDKFPSSKCERISTNYSQISWSTAYSSSEVKYCASKYNSDFLVNCNDCDRDNYDCIEESPGWCRRSSKKTTNYAVLFVFVFLILSLISLGIYLERKEKRLEKEPEGNYAGWNNEHQAKL